MHLVYSRQLLPKSKDKTLPRNIGSEKGGKTNQSSSFPPLKEQPLLRLSLWIIKQEKVSAGRESVFSFLSNLQLYFQCQAAALPACHLLCAMRDDRGLLKAFKVAVIHNLTLINLAELNFGRNKAQGLILVSSFLGETWGGEVAEVPWVQQRSSGQVSVLPLCATKTSWQLNTSLGLAGLFW